MQIVTLVSLHQEMFKEKEINVNNKMNVSTDNSVVHYLKHVSTQILLSIHQLEKLSYPELKLVNPVTVENS